MFRQTACVYSIKKNATTLKCVEYTLNFITIYLMANSYSLRLKSEFTEAEKVPGFIETISSENDFDNDLEGRIMLALSEAATNAIVHGNKEDDAKNVQISVDVSPKSVVIVVQDEGDGFNPEHTPDPTEDENLLQTGGRGIFLMEHYAEEVTYNDGGRRVTMKFKRG